MVHNGFKKRELSIVGSTPRSVGLCTGSAHHVPWILNHRRVQGGTQLNSGLSFVQKKKVNNKNCHIFPLSSVATHMLVIRGIFHQAFYCRVFL